MSKPLLRQVADVGVQLVEIQLRIQLHLLQKIAAAASSSSAKVVASKCCGASRGPSPRISRRQPFWKIHWPQRGLPLGALGGDLALQAERRRIQLVDADAEHDVLGGVEIFVVVNARAGALDPLAVRAEIRLDGAALDLVAQRVLPAIGLRHVVIIEGEQAAAEHGARQQHRRGQAIQADARRLERGHFVVLGEHAEGDQHRHQHADRQRLVDELRA